VIPTASRTSAASLRRTNRIKLPDGRRARATSSGASETAVGAVVKGHRSYRRAQEPPSDGFGQLRPSDHRRGPVTLLNPRRSSRPFPEPIARLAAGPIWKRKTSRRGRESNRRFVPGGLGDVQPDEIAEPRWDMLPRRPRHSAAPRVTEVWCEGTASRPARRQSWHRSMDARSVPSSRSTGNLVSRALKALRTRRAPATSRRVPLRSASP
jgi:hypothetical protein